MFGQIKEAAKRWLTKAGGLAMSTIVYRWMSTLEYQGFYYDPSIDASRPEFRGPVIIIFWHEYIPFLFYLRGHNNFAMLLSQHRDADLLAQAARLNGFGTVRGSSTRGGTGAIREMMDLGQNTNLTITPDGPRGPRRRLAMGPVYLAAKLGIPLVPVGLAYANPWRLKTWDKFAIPKPFSRARAISGPRIYIPAQADPQEMEQCRQSVERTLNTLTEEAERWADGNYRVAGSQTVRKAVRCTPSNAPLSDDTISDAAVPEAEALLVWRETG
jgi:lysophospholipid acyltransferase (LPLAT)-like uncharacterized protein